MSFVEPTSKISLVANKGDWILGGNLLKAHLSLILYNLFVSPGFLVAIALDRYRYTGLNIVSIYINYIMMLREKSKTL